MELRSTASEAIWGNLEIMENILGFLHERGEDNNNPMSPNDASKKDLLAACLVSKSSFLYPALNILWRHLDSLLPVLRLFPTFQKHKLTGIWSLTGTVSNDNLQRVLFYSRRIRSIRITSPPSITAGALTILSYRMHPLQPFLLLTELAVEIHRIKTILDPIFFIMPLTLTTIAITEISSTSRVAVASLLQHLSFNHGLLKHLSLTGNVDTSFLPILLECTSLRSLTLTSCETVFSAEYLRDLSDSLTLLEILSLNLLRYDPAFNAVSTGTSLPSAVFASLLDLTLTGDLPSISGILSTLRAPQLRDITLSFASLIEVDTSEAAIFAACVSQVEKINGLEGNGYLRAVKISHTNPSTCIDMSAFDALYSLRATIQVLHLEPNQMFMDDEKVYKNPLETSHYPNLVDLRLQYQPCLLPNAVSYNIEILDSLKSTCPNLKTLHISIGAGNEDQLKKLDTFDTLARPIHRLQNLVFHRLPSSWDFSISHAVALVRYLYYLFPMLSSVEYCQEGLSEDVKDWWTGVRDIFKLSQEVRHRNAITNVQKCPMK